MQELEKILEEIDIKISGSMGRKREGLLEAGDIIRKHIKNEEDILKFYYCESEDDYYIGQRVQNMYYAKYELGGFNWFMSRYLPWGKHVVNPETAWKEYTYPSEPKEIPFTEWLEGFIRKHVNDDWIPAWKPPESEKEVLILTDRGTITTAIYEDGTVPEERSIWAWTDIDFIYDEDNDINYIPKGWWEYRHFNPDDIYNNAVDENVIAWQPLPEPYRPERSEIKLKPCPFCGVEAEVLDAYGGYTVKCRSCFCWTGIYKDSKRASEAWNRRADEQNE